MIQLDRVTLQRILELSSEINTLAARSLGDSPGTSVPEIHISSDSSTKANFRWEEFKRTRIDTRSDRMAQRLELRVKKVMIKEGWRSKPYYDSEDARTVGYGCCIESGLVNYVQEEVDTLGVPDRDFFAQPLTKGEGEWWLRFRLNRAIKNVRTAFSICQNRRQKSMKQDPRDDWDIIPSADELFDDILPIRCILLLSGMVYQMGPNRLSWFQNMIRAIEKFPRADKFTSEEEYGEACRPVCKEFAREAMDSKWARQTASRAKMAEEEILSIPDDPFPSFRGIDVRSTKPQIQLAPDDLPQVPHPEPEPKTIQWRKNILTFYLSTLVGILILFFGMILSGVNVDTTIKMVVGLFGTLLGGGLSLSKDLLK